MIASSNPETMPEPTQRLPPVLSFSLYESVREELGGLHLIIIPRSLVGELLFEYGCRGVAYVCLWVVNHLSSFVAWPLSSRP